MKKSEVSPLLHYKNNFYLLKKFKKDPLQIFWFYKKFSTVLLSLLSSTLLLPVTRKPPNAVTFLRFQAWSPGSERDCSFSQWNYVTQLLSQAMASDWKELNLFLDYLIHLWYCHSSILFSSFVIPFFSWWMHMATLSKTPSWGNKASIFMLCVHLPAFIPKDVHLLVIFNCIWEKGIFNHKPLPWCFLEIMENREGCCKQEACLSCYQTPNIVLKSKRRSLIFILINQKRKPKALLVWITGT